MSDSYWQRRRLGDLVTLSVDKVPVTAGTSYPMAGVYSFGHGLFTREPLAAEKTSYGHLNQLHEGQLVMSKLKAWEGAITIVGSAFDGAFLSPEFPTYDIDEAVVLVSYMRLLTMHQPFWALLASMSTGMGGRKERVHHARALEVLLDVPPLEQQQRIVDLMDAVGDGANAASEYSQSLAAAWEALLGEFETRFTARTRIDEVIERVEAGKSPRATDRPPRDGERGVLKVSAVGRNRFVPTESKVLDTATEIPGDTAVRPGDVLVTRASGALGRVGQACRVPAQVQTGLYISDKTLRLIPSEGVDPDWLTFALLAPQARAQIEALTTGSDMRNISQKALKQVEISIPSPADQAQVAQTIRSLSDAAEAARAYADRFVALREALSEELLGGHRAIPDSYDELLDDAS